MQDKKPIEIKKCGDCPAFRPLYFKSAPHSYRQSGFGLCLLRQNTVRPLRGRVCKRVKDTGGAEAGAELLYKNLRA